MPAQPPITNLQKVLNSVKRVLSEIDHDHDRGDGYSYHTNGLVVDMGKDSTGRDTNWPEEWRSKHAGVSIFGGGDVIDPGRTGGVRRYKHTYGMAVIAELTIEQQAAGKTLVDLFCEVRDDLLVALQVGTKIQAAAVALGYPRKINDGLPLSLTDQRAVAVQGTVYDWPTVYFQLLCEFSEDKTIV
jgi:hypothetical protein